MVTTERRLFDVWACGREVLVVAFGSLLRLGGRGGRGSRWSHWHSRDAPGDVMAQSRPNALCPVCAHQGEGPHVASRRSLMGVLSLPAERPAVAVRMCVFVCLRMFARGPSVPSESTVTGDGSATAVAAVAAAWRVEARMGRGGTVFRLHQLLGPCRPGAD